MKKKLLIFLCVALGIFMLTGCSNVYQALTDGKNAVVNALVGAKDEAVDAAADAVGDGPKEAILGALNTLNEEAEKQLLQVILF